MRLLKTPIIQVVDPDTGQRVGPGETGEVVVTTFNETYPLIRLGTGDLAMNLDPAPGDSQQAAYSGQRPVSDSQEEEVGSQAAVATCVGTTSALEHIFLLGEVACAQVAACGLAVPTEAEVGTPAVLLRS